MTDLASEHCGSGDRAVDGFIVRSSQTFHDLDGVDLEGDLIGVFGVAYRLLNGFGGACVELP